MQEARNAQMLSHGEEESEIYVTSVWVMISAGVFLIQWADCRECGIEVELDDIPVDSLVPEPLQATDSVSKFMEELPKYDADMTARLEKADAAGECLRFVGMPSYSTCLYWLASQLLTQHHLASLHQWILFCL